MLQRTDGKEAIEPYKESYEKQQERTQQVNTLMSMTPVNCQLHRKLELRWLIDHNVRLIFNGKDFFILGNNYESIYEGFYDEADSDLDSDLEPEDKKPTLLSGDQQVQKPTLLNDDHQVKFCVEHESFPLGGQTGAYMFKLKINQTFTVSDNDGNSVTLTIVDDQKGAFRLKNKIE